MAKHSPQTSDRVHGWAAGACGAGLVLLSARPVVAFLGVLAGGLAGVVLHEGAHALAGRLAGLRVTAVQVGVGDELLRLGPLTLHRRLLHGGRTTFAESPALLPLAVPLAGPAANLLLALVGLLLGGSFGTAVALTNALVAVANLHPRWVGDLPSDGAQALAALGAGDWRERATGAARAEAAAFAEASAQGRQGLTVPVLQRHLAERPQDHGVRQALAVELSRAGRFAEALDQLAQVPGTTGGHAAVDAALGAHLLGQRDGHVEALAASAQALLLPISDPGRPATAHTLALARLAQGRHDEAYSLARSAWDPSLAPVDKAAVVATAALAAVGAGRPDEAHRLGTQVYASAPECPWLPLLQARIVESQAVAAR